MCYWNGSRRSFPLCYEYMKTLLFSEKKCCSVHFLTILHILTIDYSGCEVYERQHLIVYSMVSVLYRRRFLSYEDAILPTEELFHPIQPSCCVGMVDKCSCCELRSIQIFLCQIILYLKNGNRSTLSMSMRRYTFS